MPGRAGVILVVALLTAAVGCGGSGDDNSSKPKPRAGVHYTDDPGTPRRQKVEAVVNDCLRR